MSASAQTPTTTIQNGNGDTRLELNYDGGLLVPGTFGPTTPADSIPAEGAGTRLMWYPAKAAFRAGRVFDNTFSGVGTDGRTFWDPANVGNYSVAFGNNTKASGNMSLAAGINTAASERGAAAIGLGTEASAEAALATGKNTSAFQENATAMGEGTTASGRNATAMGDVTLASGFAATAMGSDTKAIDFLATAMGNKTIARGANSTAMGLSTEASGNEATAMGHGTTASGEAATAMGNGTTAANFTSLSIGSYNDANSTADGLTLFVVGNGTGSSDRSDALLLTANGTLKISGTLNESSDRRLKTDIKPLGTGTLQKLEQIRPVRYKFTDPDTHPNGPQMGLIAQDVRKEFPSLVSTGTNGMLSLTYSKFTAVLLKGLQEQQDQINTQTSQIAALRADNDAMKAQQEDLKERLAALEAQSGSLPAGATPVSGLLLAVMVLGAGALWYARSHALATPNAGSNQ